MARTFKLLLLAATLLYAVWFALHWGQEIAGISGLRNPDGTPFAGDYINLNAAGRMVLGGLAGDIYASEAFMTFERTIIPHDIGLRLWAYPPHSLLFAWPFGLVDFIPGMLAWSALGLGVLVLGARRLGFDWIETAIVALCPAALNCLYYGQTGNLAAGALLFALAGSPQRPAGPAIATALLTLKPQAGFLVPVLWIVRRQWRLILLTSGIVLAMLVVTLALFGPDLWRDYLDDTLAVLNLLEREGSGPFMMMIPSTFMALRIVLGDGQLAGILHWAVAAVVIAILVWRLVRIPDALRQAALILIATVLVTPYLHNYDLAILTAGALLVARRRLTAETPLARQVIVALLIALAWLLPATVMGLNGAGLPISPLLVLPLLFLA